MHYGISQIRWKYLFGMDGNDHWELRGELEEYLAGATVEQFDCRQFRPESINEIYEPMMNLL